MDSLVVFRREFAPIHRIVYNDVNERTEDVVMEILTANEAKINFGELLLKTQRAPVRITRSGKPVAVVVSSNDYNAIEEFKMRHLKGELARSLDDEATGKIEDFDSFFSDLMAGKYD